MPHALHAGESWSLPVPVTLLLVGTAALYVNGWRRVRAVDSEASVWHLAGFLSGVLLIWIPVASPLASWDGRSLTVHMIQHLLLMTCAPPLILLSDPVKYLVSGLPALLALATSVAIRSRPMRSVADVFAHPLVCWLAATAALVAWHVPAIFALGLQSRAWHVTEHASFLVGGVLFWWPVVEPWPSTPSPRWSIVLYLFLATLPCDILSGFLMFSDRVAYSVLLSSPERNEVAILSDQQSAAALMWTVVTLVYLVAGTIVATRLLARPSDPGDREFGRSQTPVEVH